MAENVYSSARILKDDKKVEKLSIMDSYCDPDVVKKNIEEYRIFRQLQIARETRERAEKNFAD